MLFRSHTVSLAIVTFANIVYEGDDGEAHRVVGAWKDEQFGYVKPSMGIPSELVLCCSYGGQDIYALDNRRTFHNPDLERFFTRGFPSGHSVRITVEVEADTASGSFQFVAQMVGGELSIRPL